MLASVVLLLPGTGAVRPAQGMSYSKLNKIQRRPCPGSGTPGNPPRLCVAPGANAPYNNDQEVDTAAVRVPSG